MEGGSLANEGTFRPGDVIAGKYQVERVLGRGAMAFVLAARHVELGQRVAIKMLHGGMNAHKETVIRFAREARAAARIQSDHVVRVIDVGHLQSGAPFIVMEYLDGKDLGALLEERGPLPLDETIGYLLEACEGLAEAHGAGIVHRDLKPANLFLTKRRHGRPIVKILDFGISKQQAPSAEFAGTQVGAVLGSPLYMSPEQLASSAQVDARCDIWAMGIIMYELLTGGTPFLGETMPELFRAIVKNDPVPLTAIRSELPAEIDVVLATCLKSDPVERYANVRELAAALSAIAPLTDTTRREALDRISSALSHAVSASLAPAELLRVDTLHQVDAVSEPPPNSAGVPNVAPRELMYSAPPSGVASDSTPARFSAAEASTTPSAGTVPASPRSPRVRAPKSGSPKSDSKQPVSAKSGVKVESTPAPVSLERPVTITKLSPMTSVKPRVEVPTKKSIVTAPKPAAPETQAQAEEPKSKRPAKATPAADRGEANDDGTSSIWLLAAPALLAILAVLVVVLLAGRH